MKFNELIKMWRKQAGLTLDQVAEQLHITPQALSFYENGKRTLTLELMEKIANVLKRDIEVSIRHKGEVPLTKRQRKLISDVFYGGFNIDRMYKTYQKMFDITEDEIYEGKLYDDMSEIEFLNCGKIEKVLQEEDDHLVEVKYHNEQYMMYLICNGCEAEYDVYGNIKTILIRGDVPPYTPPKRTSEDGFIYEQRKLLLPILKKTFGEKNRMHSYFFKRALGL